MTESPEPALVKVAATDLPSVNATQPGAEMAEAAVNAVAVQADEPVHTLVPEPVSVRPGPSLNGAEPERDPGAVSGPTDHPVDRSAESSIPSGPAENTNSAGVDLQPREPRRTLHLSLPHDSNARPENSHRRDADMAGRSGVHHGSGEQGSNLHFTTQNPAAPTSNNGEAARSVGEPEKTREGGAFIDRALRERVNGDISAFLAAFDAALADDTIESRSGLREATDRLLRAGARTRIELERLDARMPLAARGAGSYQAPNWRPR